MSLSNHRLPDPPSAGFEDDEAAREYGRQLAMDLVLHRLYHSVAEQTPVQRRTNIIRWLGGFGAAAAAVLLAGFFFVYLQIDKRAPKSERWEVEAEAAAEFVVVEPFHVRLDRGELRVPAAERRQEVKIETEFATAVATGSEFRISQVSEPAAEPAPFEEEVEVTTIEVVSGKVTLTTPDGTIIGVAGETLVAVKGEAPRKE